MAEGGGVIRAQRAALAAWLALMATGCVGWRVESAPPAEVVRNPDVHAVRVIKRDKSKVEIYDPSLQGDSIVGNAPAPANTSLGTAVLAVMTIGGGAAVYAALQSLNQGY